MASARPDPLSLPPVPPPAPERHRWRDRLLVALFVLAVALPGLALLVTASRTTTRFENRPAAPWPSGPGRGFTVAFERALADRFGGRDELVRLHHTLKAQLFQVSPVSKVLIGRDDWLYYLGDDGRALDRVLRRNPPPTASETAAIVEGIRRRAQALQERGIAWRLVVVPDKYTVYPEHVPASLQPLSPVSPLDAVLAALPASLRSMVVDLREPLREAARERLVYYRTDSHWNVSGGWIAYQEILAAMREATGRPVRPREPLPPEYADRSTSGDLARMLGITERYTEPDPALRLPAGWHDCARDESGRPAGWGVARQVLRCSGAEIGRATIHHDSMGYALLSYLPHHIGQSLWVEGRSWDLAHLESERPEILVDEIVERNLAMIADTRFLDNGLAVAPAARRPQAWQPGLPQGHPGSGRRTDSCALDQWNGKAADMGISARAGDAIHAEGWAAHVERSALPLSAWLILQDGPRAVHVPVETGLARPDVAAATRRSSLVDAGWQLHAEGGALQAGRYRVTLVWLDFEGWASCDTRRTVQVEQASP